MIQPVTSMTTITNITNGPSVPLLLTSPLDTVPGTTLPSVASLARTHNILAAESGTPSRPFAPGIDSPVSDGTHITITGHVKLPAKSYAVRFPLAWGTLP